MTKPILQTKNCKHFPALNLLSFSFIRIYNFIQYCVQKFKYANVVGWPSNKHIFVCFSHRVHRVAMPLSGVHSIMMEKSSQAGEGGECTPSPFHFIYHHKQSCGVRSSRQGRYTLPISPLPRYVLCDYSDKNVHMTRIRFLIQYEISECRAVRIKVRQGKLRSHLRSILRLYKYVHYVQFIQTQH